MEQLDEELKRLEEHPEVPIKRGKPKIRVRGDLKIELVEPIGEFEVVQER